MSKPASVLLVLNSLCPFICASENTTTAPSPRKQVSHLADANAHRNLESKTFKLPKANKISESVQETVNNAEGNTESTEENSSTWFWDPMHRQEPETDSFIGYEELKTDHFQNNTIVSNATDVTVTSDSETENLFEHANGNSENDNIFDHGNNNVKQESSSQVDNANNASEGEEELSQVGDTTISFAETSKEEAIIIENTVDAIVKTEQTKKIQYILIFISIGLVGATIAMLVFRRRRNKEEQAAEVYTATFST